MNKMNGNKVKSDLNKPKYIKDEQNEYTFAVAKRLKEDQHKVFNVGLVDM